MHGGTAVRFMKLLFLLLYVRFVTHIQLKIHRRVDDHPNIIRFLGVSKGNGEKIRCIIKWI